MANCLAKCYHVYHNTSVMPLMWLLNLTWAIFGFSLWSLHYHLLFTTFWRPSIDMGNQQRLHGIVLLFYFNLDNWRCLKNIFGYLKQLLYHLSLTHYLWNVVVWLFFCFIYFFFCTFRIVIADLYVTNVKRFVSLRYISQIIMKIDTTFVKHKFCPVV